LGIVQTALYIRSIKDETPGVKTFVFDAEMPVEYKAGQFLTLVFNHHGKEERRSFSLSGSPALKESLQITVKRVVNGAYSRYLTDKAKVGDTFISTGAAGLFTLPDNIKEYRQLFLFAAGIGITPLFAIIKEALYTLPGLQLVLIYSNRTREETVFCKELLALQEQFPGRLKIEFLFSNSFDLKRARLSKELIPTLLQEHSITEKYRQLFYTCGPYDYMRMVMYGLEEQDIPATQIKKENFDTSIPVIKQAPPDQSPHMVDIQMGGERHSIKVQYPETILHAAQRQGISLPYSCDAGRCGTCVARCTEGKIWHSVNEVLTDADIEKGLVLTCTGYPIDGDARIEFKTSVPYGFSM
jgi:ring-1,2-phenylacetyl-CoA epoxidase subunit PaaE